MNEKEKEINIGLFKDHKYPIEEVLKNHEYNIIIHHITPEITIPIKEKFNISCTSWETDLLNPKWSECLNKMDLCIVSCKENISAYKKGGLKVPIEYVPLAFDVKKYTKKYEPLDLPDIKNFKFKFYSIFQMTRKKGLDPLLVSYYSQFTGNDDVVLVLKSYINMANNNNELKEFHSYINMIKQSMKLNHFPKVYIINDHYTDEEILRLHNTCDAYVLPSRAEGWSIPHFEAMAFCKYPIAVNWGGPTEFINSGQNGRLINYELQPVTGMNHPYPFLYTSYENWAEPSIKDLKLAMKESYNFFKDPKFKEYLEAHKQKHLDQFSYENVGKQLTEIINKYYNEWKEKNKNG